MSLSKEATAFLLVCGAGMSTCLGAAIVYSETLVQMTSKKILAGGLGIATGVMMYVSFLEIMIKSFDGFIDEGYSEKDAKLYSYLCFFAGFAIMYGLELIVHWLDPGETHCVCGENIDLDSFFKALNEEQKQKFSNIGSHESLDAIFVELNNMKGDRSILDSLGSTPEEIRDNKLKLYEILKEGGHHSHSHEVTSVNGSGQTPVPATSGADEEGKEYTATPETSLENFKQIKLKKMGVMTALAIALHNLPEGLATFVAAMDDPVVGAALAIAIALHNIPEGICVSVPIYFSTGDRHKAFGWAFLSGISELIGAALGWIVLSQAMNDLVYGLLFGLVAGMMVYICIYQLQPTAHRYDPEDTIVTATTVTGMAIMAASLVLFLY